MASTDNIIIKPRTKYFYNILNLQVGSSILGCMGNQPFIVDPDNLLVFFRLSFVLANQKANNVLDLFTNLPVKLYPTGNLYIFGEYGRNDTKESYAHILLEIQETKFVGKVLDDIGFNTWYGISMVVPYTGEFNSNCKLSRTELIPKV